MIRENTSSLSAAAEAAQQQQRQQPYRIDAGYFNYPNELLGNYSCLGTPSRPHICALRPESSSSIRRRTAANIYNKRHCVRTHTPSTNNIKRRRAVGEDDGRGEGYNIMAGI